MPSSTNADAISESTSIPLLNCVNVQNPLGYYGNCLLLPFYMPEALAKEIGSTSASIQERLYKYHTTSFRVPTTTISLPTSGMVGEAVLGETNVSELIDLTRFWNWKDSDIDHMNISVDDLKDSSLLSSDNATTKDIVMPTTGVAATAHIDSNDILKALLSKDPVQFADIASKTDMRDLLSKAEENTASGRDAVITTNADMMKSALSAAASIATGGLSAGAQVDTAKTNAEAEKQKAAINADAAKEVSKNGGSYSTGEIKVTPAEKPAANTAKPAAGDK